MPFFSIIITCFNHHRFLEPMKAMLMAQKFQDFEIILVDNNSSDGSKKWIEDSDFQWIYTFKILNDKNIGICKAFNQAVKQSNGKFLIDLSPDDYFEADKLEKNYTLIQNNRVELIFSDCLIKSDKEKIGLYSDLYPIEYKGVKNYFVETFSKHCLSPCSFVFSRKIFEELNGYDETLFYEDFDFISRATFFYDVAYDSAVLVHKWQGESNFSNQFRKRKSPMHLSTFAVCEKMIPYCTTKEQKWAMESRINLEIIGQLKLFNFSLAWKYINLAKKFRNMI